MAVKKGKPVVPRTRLGAPPKEDIESFTPKLYPAPPELLSDNLEKYRQLAIDMGAEDAKIISAKDIPQDIRAHYMFCHFPRCRWLNSSIMCPTNRGQAPWEDAVEAVTNYGYAIAFKVLPPDKDVVAEAAETVGKIDLDMYWTMGGGEPPNKELLLTDIVRQRIIAEILRRIEQESYYDGYLLAMSLGVGSCLPLWCSDTKTCRALEKGGFCPIVNARPTGNAEFYIDYHTLGRKLGWGEMQPRGNRAMQVEIPEFEGFYNIGLALIK